MDSLRPSVVAVRRARILRSPRAVAGALTVAAAVLIPATSSRAAPPACNGVPQIADVAGDGHHSSSDVLSAWLTEAGGSLQAVIQVRAATFVPEHGDADLNGSGFAMLFTLDGRLDYVRARAAPDGSLTYDYGTYAAGSYFTTLGATTGIVERSPGAGDTVIDIPAAFGAMPGSVLSGPYAITYDGINAGAPDWVDHAPGGVEPDDTALGADYVVGSCGAGGGGGGGGGGQGGGPPGAPSAVTLSAPKRQTGTGRALISGSVVPAQAGVDVAIRRSAHASATAHLKTAADGSFAVMVDVGETTRVQATAGGLRSGMLTIDVRSRTRLRVRHDKTGGYLSGTVDPKLPGKALLLRPDSPTTVATASVKHGRFSFHPTSRRPLRGAYQVVYVPSQERAERSTSATAHVR
jgi:hypothetical protein